MTKKEDEVKKETEKKWEKMRKKQYQLMFEPKFVYMSYIRAKKKLRH